MQVNECLLYLRSTDSLRLGPESLSMPEEPLYTWRKYRIKWQEKMGHAQEENFFSVS